MDLKVTQLDLLNVTITPPTFDPSVVTSFTSRLTESGNLATNENATAVYHPKITFKAVFEDEFEQYMSKSLPMDKN
jgi:hypothetical protein